MFIIAVKKIICALRRFIAAKKDKRAIARLCKKYFILAAF
jgi:hypothetical protein